MQVQVTLDDFEAAFRGCVSDDVRAQNCVVASAVARSLNAIVSVSYKGKVTCWDNELFNRSYATFSPINYVVETLIRKFDLNLERERPLTAEQLYDQAARENLLTLEFA